MTQEKTNILLLFGGQSGEHEVSIDSAMSVFKAFDQTKYNLQLAGIDHQGRWHSVKTSEFLLAAKNPREFIIQNHEPSVQQGSDRILQQTSNTVVFPLLHGSFGEDGKLQGLLEMAGLPYIGSGVLASALCMDKDMARKILHQAKLPVVPGLMYYSKQLKSDAAKIAQEVADSLGYPCFVKPANLGSSVGISKVKEASELPAALAEAGRYDLKIVIEKAVDARELECAILDGDLPLASGVGEVIPKGDFYDYQAKYIDPNGAQLDIPARNLSPTQVQQVKQLSIAAFRTLNCEGLARVDFFLDKNNHQLFINEVNTMPGFTAISQYPLLWQQEGVDKTELIDRLVQKAIQSFAQRASLSTTYKSE